MNNLSTQLRLLTLFFQIYKLILIGSGNFSLFFVFIIRNLCYIQQLTIFRVILQYGNTYIFVTCMIRKNSLGRRGLILQQNEDKIKFDLNETLYFESGQEIEEMVSIS